MRDAARGDGVRQRAGDVVLADEVLEGLRAVLAGEDEVAHGGITAYNARRADATVGYA